MATANDAQANRPNLIALDAHRPPGLTRDDERLTKALLPGLPFGPWGGVKIDVTDEGGRLASLMHPLIPSPQAAAIIDRDHRGVLVYGRGELVGIGGMSLKPSTPFGDGSNPIPGRFRDS